MATPTRAEQRRLKLLEIEKEQRREDDEALKMTEEQRQTLLRSFQSVKFEFHDLDGLSWTDSIRQKLCTPELEDIPRVVGQRPSESFAVFSKADLSAFSPDETIRISAVRRTGFPFFSSSHINAGKQGGVENEEHPPKYTQYSSGKPSNTTLKPSTPDFSTPVLRRGKRDGTRTRSPIKGLFSAFSSLKAAEVGPEAASSDVKLNVNSDMSDGNVKDQETVKDSTFHYDSDDQGYESPGDRWSGVDWDTDEGVYRDDDQATIRMREPSKAVSLATAAAHDLQPNPYPPPSVPSSPTLLAPPPVPSSHLVHSRPPPAPVSPAASPRMKLDAGIITSIFRSPVFSQSKGGRHQCSVAFSPKSSPSLASICSFS